MKSDHKNGHPQSDPPSALDTPTAAPGDEGRPSRYTVSTTAKPTVRLFNPKTGDAAHAGAVRSGSIRVGALPKTERLLRIPTSTPPVDTGWTRPVTAKPFVTRSFSGVRIRPTDPTPAPIPEDTPGS